MSININSLIEILKSDNRISLENVMLANPYSSGYSIGKLSDKEFEQVFLSEMFQKFPEYNQSFKTAVKWLTPGGNDEKETVFFRGYSGSGKSTFVYWLKRNIDPNSFYVKIHNLDDCSDMKMEPFKAFFTNQLEERMDLLPELLELILLLKTEIRKICPEIIEWLDSDCNIPKMGSLKILKKLKEEFDEVAFTFIYWIGVIFFPEKFQWKIDKINILIFDNLDAVDIDFFSKHFQKLFADLAASLVQLSRKSMVVKLLRERKLDDFIGFTAAFKICYVLRDTTEAVVDSHFRRRFRNKVGRLNLGFSTINCYENRVKFAAKILPNEKFSEQQQLLFKDLTRNEYIKKIIRTGVNYNQRKLTDFIRYCIQDDKIFKILLEYKILLRKSPYGARGIIWHYYIKYLVSLNYLKKYPEIYGNFWRRKSFYNPLRTILILILNLGFEEFDLDNTNIQGNRVTLWEVCSKAAILFEYEEILKSIDAYYRTTGSGASHLITIFNKNVKSEKDWDKELKLFLYLKADWVKDRNSAKKELERISVRVTPAGFIYLFHVVRHFEFYSLLINRDHLPLFSYSHYDKDSDTFSFEAIIENVYNRVEMCIHKMKNFYNQKISGAFLDDVHLFKKSDFNYKFIQRRGINPNLLIKVHEKGKLHSLRVIHTHLGYLESFRQYLLIINSSKDTKTKINQKLSLLLRKYVELLNEILLPKKETMYHFFNNKLQKIENNPENFDTKISHDEDDDSEKLN